MSLEDRLGRARGAARDSSVFLPKYKNPADKEAYIAGRVAQEKRRKARADADAAVWIETVKARKAKP